MRLASPSPSDQAIPFWVMQLLRDNQVIPQDRIRGLILVTCISRTIIFLGFKKCSGDHFGRGEGTRE